MDSLRPPRVKRKRARDKLFLPRHDAVDMVVILLGFATAVPVAGCKIEITIRALNDISQPAVAALFFPGGKPPLNFEYFIRA